MCIRRETREKARRSLAFFPVSMPHTHITYMLRQCTSIVYIFDDTFSLKYLLLITLITYILCMSNCVLALIRFSVDIGRLNSYKYHIRTSTSSFIQSTVSLWNNQDISIRNFPTLSSFKNRVKVDIYKTPKYYNEGPRKLSILHTRIRHQCSSLNADMSKIHIINNLKCNCGASFEDAIHYFLECSLYLNERRTLLSNCDDININIENLLFGNDMYSYDVNSKIFGKVRTFINQSKRF